MQKGTQRLSFSTYIVPKDHYMRPAFVLAAMLLLPPALPAQQNPASLSPDLARKITIAGVCLCRTTLSDLRQRDKDLAEAEIEDMEYGKRCEFGGDSRFSKSKGYASKTYPGMIFQKDPDNDYISRIRLTSGFNGNLPDGTPVNLDSLLVKDVIRQYPSLESTWSTRDCSDYITFSNDTVAFYVKIDRTKKPLYPIDEAYYLNRPVAGIDLFLSCYSIYHRSESVQLFGPDEPLYILDSIRVNSEFLNSIDPNDISTLTVYKGPRAVEVAGKEAKNGAIYILTKRFVRDHYWQYFQSKSEEYHSKVPDLKTEAGVVYILNGKVLGKDQEDKLFELSDTNFTSLTVIDRDALKNTYRVTGHTIGVVIKSRTEK